MQPLLILAGKSLNKATPAEAPGRKRYAIGVDIGGTFTDLVLHDSLTGTSRAVKSFTTPEDPSAGFLDAVDRAGVSLSEVETFLTHGSTTALNTILTRTGVKVGFITTRGHRDMLDIGRAFREEGHLYDPSWQRPHVARPVVPRYLRRTVRERIVADGSVLWPLDEDELRSTIAALRDEDVAVIAICFLNSYKNPAHEHRAREIVQEEWPDVPVELSSEVAPVPREYDRAITLALNSYVSPVVASYLTKIATEIEQRGYGRTLYVMQSHGGLMEADMLRRVPIATMMSGPVAGVIGARHLALTLGIPSVLTFDMGGTSTDVAAITQAEFSYSKRYQIEWDIYSILPMVEISSVGQGGGSIAWLDSAGALRVGPQSAGAEPGPACYGRGGKEPTITDSNLLRGVLQEETFVGGEVELYPETAADAMRELGGGDGQVIELARGIYDIANANMIEAIRGVTIYKGIDPREYTLLCYGSAGGQHISAIASELGIRDIIIPPAPGTFSAFGLICSDLKVDKSKPVVQHLDDLSDQALTEGFVNLEREGLELLNAQGVDPEEVVVQRMIEGHYLGQTWETVAAAPLGAFDEERRAELESEFHKTHERLWAFRADDLAIVVINLRVSLVGATKKPEFPDLPQGSGKPSEAAVLFSREVHVGADQLKSVPFYARGELRVRDQIDGPAAVAEKTSTTWLMEGDRCSVDRFGNLLIRKEG